MYLANRRLPVVIAQLQGENTLLVVFNAVVVQNEALILEDLSYSHFELGRRHINCFVLRRRRVADACYEIGDCI